MPNPYPGVRFSIRPDDAGWLWRAVLDDVVLGEGHAPTRALAAAMVIRQICLSQAPVAQDVSRDWAEAA